MLVVVLTPFIAQRSQEIEQVTKQAVCIAGDSTKYLQVISALLEEDKSMTTPCLGPFAGEEIQSMLEKMVRDWRPLHIDPELDMDHRRNKYGSELRFLEPLFDSFWPKYWYFELLTIARQFVILLFSVLLDVEATTYMLTSLIIMTFYVMFVLKASPYTSWQGTAMQLISCGVFVFVILMMLLLAQVDEQRRARGGACLAQDVTQSPSAHNQDLEKSLFELTLVMVFMILGLGVAAVVCTTLSESAPSCSYCPRCVSCLGTVRQWVYGRCHRFRRRAEQCIAWMLRGWKSGKDFDDGFDLPSIADMTEVGLLEAEHLIVSVSNIACQSRLSLRRRAVSASQQAKLSHQSKCM